MAEAIEYTRAQQLRQRQNQAQRTADALALEGKRSATGDIPLVEGGILAIFLAFIFDIPALLVAFVPFIGWIFAGVISLLGRFIAIMWIAFKGRLNFDTIKRSGWAFVLSSSGLIISFLIQEQAEKEFKKHI